jgi:hypothetical protein
VVLSAVYRVLCSWKTPGFLTLLENSWKFDPPGKISWNFWGSGKLEVYGLCSLNHKPYSNVGLQMAPLKSVIKV